MTEKKFRITTTQEKLDALKGQKRFRNMPLNDIMLILINEQLYAVKTPIKN
jgi:hypothetical protein